MCLLLLVESQYIGFDFINVLLQLSVLLEVGLLTGRVLVVIFCGIH